MIYSLITGICIITVCILIILKPIFSGLKKSWCGQELINGLARSWNKLGKYETIYKMKTSIGIKHANEKIQIESRVHHYVC